MSRPERTPAMQGDAECGGAPSQALTTEQHQRHLRSGCLAREPGPCSGEACRGDGRETVGQIEDDESEAFGADEDLATAQRLARREDEPKAALIVGCPPPLRSEARSGLGNRRARPSLVGKLSRRGAGRRVRCGLMTWIPPPRSVARVENHHPRADRIVDCPMGGARQDGHEPGRG